MAGKMLEALREVVRARYGLLDAQMQLAQSKRVLREAVDGVFELEEVVGETNVVSLDGQVFVVTIDLDEGKLAEVREVDYWILDGAFVRGGTGELSDYVEGEL